MHNCFILFYRKFHLVSYSYLGNFALMVASFCMKKKSDLPVGVSLTIYDVQTEGLLVYKSPKLASLWSVESMRSTMYL